MTVTIQELTRRANELPEPHRTDARANVQDAWNDLVIWPEHRDRILADLQHAIKAHEAETHPQKLSGAGRQACCKICHTCQQPLREVLDGELWCDSCKAYR